MRFIESRHSRRNIVVGAGIGLLATVVAACSSAEKKPAADTGSAPSSAASSGAASPGKTDSGNAGKAITKTADVPVGSGVIVGDVVVTQPTAGVFSGFSAVCPHAGCNVSAITDGKIVCPCHGSKFNLDGTVAQGPAKKPLGAKTVTVQGDSIVEG